MRIVCARFFHDQSVRLSMAHVNGNVRQGHNLPHPVQHGTPAHPAKHDKLGQLQAVAQRLRPIREVLQSRRRAGNDMVQHASSIVGVRGTRIVAQGTGGSSRTSGTSGRRSYVQTLSKLVLPSTLPVPGQAQSCRGEPTGESMGQGLPDTRPPTEGRPGSSAKPPLLLGQPDVFEPDGSASGWGNGELYSGRSYPPRHA
jgi:hypothetical protein